MNKLITIILLAIFIASNFSSCKKNDDKTPSKILTSHKWRLFRVGQSSDDINISWSSPTDSCVSDDTWLISDNGQLIWDNGVIKCSSTDPQIYYNGTWQLESNNTIIRLNNGNNPDLKVINLTENSLTTIELDSFYPHDCYDLVPY